MDLCTKEDIKDLLLQDYIDACEQKNPGITERTITAVSGEVVDMVALRYPQPWPSIPNLLRYATSVIAAYRIVESITSLVSTEASVGNEWIPLQKQWKHVNELLKDIAKGKVKLPKPDDPEVAGKSAEAVVISKPPLFGDLKL